MRYLLSVDRSLGRVSLKKISASVKNANNRVRARSAKKNAARGTTRSQNPSVPNGGRSVRVVVPALIAVVAAATLIAAPGVFQRSDPSIASDSVGPTASAAQATLPPASQVDTTTAATELVSPGAAARLRTPDTPAGTGRVVESPHLSPVELPLGTAVESPRTTAVEPAPHADATVHAKPIRLADSTPRTAPRPRANSTANAEPKSSAAPLTSAAVMNEGAVTISGCLQTHDDSFWLKDPSGANAPKSRSWKSGFLKKHAEPVQLVDATRALQLSNYVAQRVTATGTLANRTIQVRSLERLGASCH
jgi:hypothetical protein